MGTCKKIKTIQLFDKYSEFYQSYIPPVMEALLEQYELDIKIIAFNGKKRKTDESTVLPSYKRRKILTSFYKLINKDYRGLDYFEIKAIKEKVDIIHLQHSFLFSKIINLLKRPQKNRPKIIITLRGGDTYVKPWISNRWQNFYKDYGNKVDAFVVMSEDQKKYLSRWGVPISSIHVIPISFGKRFLALPKKANEQQIRLASVFRMCWEKNITDNLRFINGLKQKNIPVIYDVYGDGPDLGQLYYLRDKYDLKEEVNILGRVPNGELMKRLIGYDFILQLSLSEAFPTSVLEAQANGVLAIVSNKGGLPELILNGQNGVVVDKEDFETSIQEVIDIWCSKSKYLGMSKNAIERVQQNYAIENETERLSKLYMDLSS